MVETLSTVAATMTGYTATKAMTTSAAALETTSCSAGPETIRSTAVLMTM